MKKLLLFILVIFSSCISQENKNCDHSSLYQEALGAADEKFTFPLPVDRYELYKKGKAFLPFGHVKSPFGNRFTFRRYAAFFCPNNTPVTAAAGGVVSFIGWDSRSGGKTVIIKKGNLECIYVFINPSQKLKKHQHVRKGDRIGSVNSHGRALGPSLHFAIRFKGIYLNPLVFFDYLYE